jgi:hypothetical protein
LLLYEAAEAGGSVGWRREKNLGKVLGLLGWEDGGVDGRLHEEMVSRAVRMVNVNW